MIYGSATLLLCCWRGGGFAALLRFGLIFDRKIVIFLYIYIYIQRAAKLRPRHRASSKVTK